jgi:hypothetical protein
MKKTDLFRKLVKGLARAAVPALLVASQSASAAFVGGAEYLIGRDRLQTLTSGTYAGLANPNFGRPTLLWNHGNHFHGIGQFSYSGPAATPVINPTNANNRLPEIHSLQPPLALSAGSGLYEGKLVNVANPAVKYSSITLKGIDVLFDGPPGSAENILLSSSNGRWGGSMANSKLALELVSATPGLKMGNSSTLDLFGTGNRYLLGDGATLDFTPVFWVAGNAPAGTYSAEFRLLDLGTNNAVLGQGGTFNLDFAAPVPVPPAVWLLGSALAALGVSRKRAAAT